MKWNRVISVFLLTVSAGALTVCGPDDPTSIDRPPVVRHFVPEDQVFDAFLGDTLTFGIVAMDPDKSSLKQRFSLNDSVVSSSSMWDYVVDDTGLAVVKCIVTDGVYDSRIQWEVSRYKPISYSPVIYAFLPIEPNPVMIIGEDLEFAIQATDADDDSLGYYFTVNDTIVSRKADFVYTATSIGSHEVEGVVTDGENYDSHLWNLTVTPVPDTIPPAEVEILSVETGVEPGEIIIEWIAVGADGMEGVASDYMVRTSPAPFEDEISWSRGSKRPGVPDPAQPGETMRMVLDELTPARFTYIAVRAEDDFGNLSPLGASPGGYTRGMRISGKVMDAITGLPVPGAQVDLAHFHTTTDPDGDFEFIELPPIDDALVVSDDGQLGEVGAYYDYYYLYEVVHGDYHEVYLIPDYRLESEIYRDLYEIDFLAFFKAMTRQPGIPEPYPLEQHRWSAPINIHAAPYENGGLDYQATIHQVALDLNAHLGMELFNVTDSDPSVGVSCSYRADIVYDRYGTDVWSVPDYYPVHGKIEFRMHYTIANEQAFRRVVRHELGHALGLNHSVDDIHIMIGGVAPKVDNFSSDEIALIRCRYHLQRGLPVSRYIRE
jgi:hypothetical protein